MTESTDEGLEERILETQLAAAEQSDVHRSPEHQVECATSNCRRAAAVCDECIRALALMFFGGIARHPELREPEDTACALCELGAATWCPSCALNGAHGVMARRRHLREHGGYTDIRVGRDIPEGAHLSLEQLAELQEAARRGGWTGFKRGEPMADLPRRGDGGLSGLELASLIRAELDTRVNRRGSGTDPGRAARAALFRLAHGAYEFLEFNGASEEELRALKAVVDEPRHDAR